MKTDVYEKLIKCHINESSKYTGKVKCILCRRRGKYNRSVYDQTTKRSAHGPASRIITRIIGHLHSVNRTTIEKMQYLLNYQFVESIFPTYYVHCVLLLAF